MGRLGLAAVLALAGCAYATPPPDTARWPNPPGVIADNDLWAINLAAWAFADPARTRGNPVNGARAVAALDYLAGEISSSPRWAGVSPLIKMQLLDARQEARAALGIEANAPSQFVVNGLVGAADWLLAGNPANAAAEVNGPVFSLGPQETLARLANLPYLHMANVATLRLSSAAGSSGGQDCDWGC